jgi:DNA (cytosine-5)-methyltransferase 1
MPLRGAAPAAHGNQKIRHDRFYFDGVLSFGDVKHYVQKVEVSELPIGNYSTSHATTRGQIWVRSRLNSGREVYYRLGQPRIEYERFFTPFLWLADLAKHVVDYSAAMVEKGRQVEIRSFKSHFAQWMVNTHGQSAEFQDWRRNHPSDDYRTSVAANISFIWKEMNGVLGWKMATGLQLFHETIYFSLFKAQTVHPPFPMVTRGDEAVPPTIVTPYIKECFGHMIIGKMLHAVGNSTRELPGPGAQSLHVPVALPAPNPSNKRGRKSEPCFLPLDVIDRIKPGDTISTPRDGETTDTKWRRMASKGSVEDDRWFGLVRKVHVAKDGARSFDVTWFYRPVETPCCMMKYPWPNELFLSDHCTCEEVHHRRVKEHQVLAIHNIDWFGSPGRGNGEFFVRQSYIVETRRWLTLERAHITCSHDRQRLGFRKGDTVLATITNSQPFAEAYEVVKICRQGETMFVRLRCLLRRSQIDPESHAPPNELVYTDRLVVAKPDRVIGKCLVRFFRVGDSIPTPYDRGGTGNLFYITHRLERRDDEPSVCMPLDGDFPTSMRQGFDPSQTIRKLRGMDLFCGSGNFGRGLEEGGAIEMRWANDIWDRAIHTYMANSPDPKSTKPFLGSVDDLLRLALEGKYADNAPRPGEVDFISAGSPCPGFSLLTQDKTTLAQIKNQSLVASFASFVDFYRPKHGILENVSSIVQSRRNRSEDVLSQLFCAIVGMGYQAQLILGDAWSHGAPQSRNRVFLYFASPGQRLPEAPLLSHSHFPAVGNRGLGQMCNGEPFVSRSFQRTPFQYVSAGKATADLPLIGDGKAEPAIAFPDHRVCRNISPALRQQIAVIPTQPYGMSFVSTWRHGKGVMTRAERELFPAEGSFRVTPLSKGWGRVRPGGVFQTVTTTCQPTDAKTGTVLHWADSRPLTVLEVRRAQGFPDEEVLLGLAHEQWKLVGNSVARQMALALGLKFREVWVGGMGDGSANGGGGADGGWMRPAAGVRRADGVQAAAVTNGQPRSGTVEIIDLTSEPPEEEETHRDSTDRDVIDLTSPVGSPSPSPRRDVRGASASSHSQSSRPGGTRKRSHSQSGSEATRAPKVVRLDSPEPTPVQRPERRPATGGASPMWGVEQGYDTAPARDSSPQHDDITPPRNGPTVVRLWSPEE